MSTKPINILLITQQRNGSDPLRRLLCQQPNMAKLSSESTETGTARFFRKFVTDERLRKFFSTPEEQRTEDDRAYAFQKGYKATLDDLNSICEKANSENKFVFNKEHLHWFVDPVIRSDYVKSLGNLDFKTATRGTISLPEGESRNNITVFSDAWLSKWQPIFVIRHPALTAPSQLRADLGPNPTAAELVATGGDEIMRVKLRTCLDFARELFNWYCEKTNIRPIVIDSDDVMATPASGVVVELCRLTGMNENEIITKWPARKQQYDIKQFQQRMTGRIDTSTHIMSGPNARRLVLNEEVMKWKGEFGEEIADLLEKIVNEMMSSYKYLEQFKLQPQDV